MPTEDEPPSVPHSDSIEGQGPPDAEHPKGFLSSLIRAAVLGVMAGAASMVVFGAFSLFWVLVGEFGLSEGFQLTMFFTAVIALLGFVGASIVLAWQSAPVRGLLGRRRERQMARRRRAGRFGTDAEAFASLDAAQVAHIVESRPCEFRESRLLLLAGRAGYETLSEYASGGNHLWQQLFIWGTRGSTPLRRELDVRQAYELATDGQKLSRPDLIGARVLATTTGRVKRMRRNEEVVVVAVIPPKDVVGADLRLVYRLRDAAARPIAR
jgi:hypothetical protein